MTAGEVHLWQASLALPQALVQGLQRTLAPDEQARAARYRFPRDRDRFIAARGLLRAILGPYLAAAPEDLRFGAGPYGKPWLQLAPGRGPGELRFNLSYSGDLALYALALGREVGVDVEWMRAELAFEEIARFALAPEELSALAAVPPGARREAFYACWTAKEAYIKALGEGLSHPLDAFVVSLDPGRPAALLHSARDPDAPARWRLQRLQPAPGYLATLAVEGHDWELIRLHWPER